MNSLIKKYSKGYRRVSIISDHKSEYASSILFYGIREWMEHHIPLTLKLSRSEPLSKLHVLDKFNLEGEYEYVPFSTLINNWHANIKSDDGFLFRGITYIGMSGGVLRGTPHITQYNSDLIIQLVDNKLSIIKDRYGIERDKYTNMDVKPFLINAKIKKILKNIKDD